MKTFILITSFGLILAGCDKPNNDDNNENTPEYKIVDDIYQGHYAYQGIDYGCSVTFEGNDYHESALGGLYYTKGFKCLSVGTYNIDKEVLYFELDSFTYGEPSTIYCQPDILLPGEYTIDYLKDDSLVFERGNGESRIVYFLKGIGFFQHE